MPTAALAETLRSRGNCLQPSVSRLRMKTTVREAAESLKNLPYFESVGRPNAVDLASISFTEVTDYEGCRRAISSAEWENVRINRIGDLTEHLHAFHNIEYNTRWDMVVDETHEMIEGILEPVVRRALEREGLPQDFFTHVHQDLRCSIFEMYWHSKFRKAPRFFHQLIKLYSIGKLPCGWTNNEAGVGGDFLVY